MKTAFSVLVAALFLSTAQADPWDGADDVSNKPHDLTHGADEAHDLAARPGAIADVDWSRVPQDSYSSYEVVVDGIASQVESVDLARFNANGSLLMQNGAAPNTAGGTTRVLEWQNGGTPLFGLIRVQGAMCGGTCAKDAVYRIRAADTTISVPKFTNSASVSTVLIIQNMRPTARTASVYFWNHMGQLMIPSATTVTVPARGSASLQTQMLVTGGGSITITHDAGYGGLVVKATTTDSGLNFSYDTAGIYRAR
jgi:hypothetical protein